MSEISVIVPVYNVEQYIRRCVDSILSQTFTDFELILVDDGSPDNCPTICDEYAKKDDRIKVFHQTNQGQAAARNKALDWVLSNGSSEYIAFVDSDDWVHPKYLELLYLANKRFGTNISQCLHIEIDGTAEELPVRERIRLITAEEQYVNWYSAFFWGKLFSIKAWESIRFPEGQIYEDVAIWYKILFAEDNIGLVEEVLYYYFINQNGTVRSDWSPDKLKQIDAWEAQISFFDYFGNKELLDCAAMHFFQILQLHLYKISKSKSISWIERIKYKFLVRRKLWKAMLQFKKAPYYTQKKLSILGSAFPTVMWFYWTFFVVKRKLSDLFKKRSA